MNKPEWKDTTSYSRIDKDRIPTTFEICDGLLRVVVTCGHIYYKPQWVMHCQALSIDTRPLRNAATKDQAQTEALHIVRNLIEELSNSASRLTP